MGEHNCYGSDSHECVRTKAYELWEKDGRKPDRDLEYWLLAEINVNAPARQHDHKHQTKESR